MSCLQGSDIRTREEIFDDNIDELSQTLNITASTSFAGENSTQSNGTASLSSRTDAQSGSTGDEQLYPNTNLLGTTVSKLECQC